MAAYQQDPAFDLKPKILPARPAATAPISAIVPDPFLMWRTREVKQTHTQADSR